MQAEELIDEANNWLSEIAEEPLTFEEFVEQFLDNPQIASKSSQYLLNAIEYYGTRTVIEKGEEVERYKFFDDIPNNGEHAILGNTKELNQFVEKLRQLANTDAKITDKIIWFDGPTATGKSELKRCLVNGLEAYSRTDEGRRYTVEWNLNTQKSDRVGLSYNDSVGEVEEDWFENPVQTNPLCLLPEEIRQEYVSELDYDVPLNMDMDPFSREAFRQLKRHYESEGAGEDMFSKITAPPHLRIVRYSVTEGQGIGVLHSEDQGAAKERLIGSWLPQMFEQLGSRGRKNPHAYSYDGLLSQGNGTLSIIEEASQHADLLQKLLNVPDEGFIKLDQRIPFEIDTVLLILSNPDLQTQLDQHADRTDDPLKALKRRLDRLELRYLLSMSDEVQLIRRETLDERGVWVEDFEEKSRQPATIDGAHFEPHTLQAAALYAVVTRLDKTDCDGLSLVEKALLYEQGYVEKDGEEKEKDDFDFNGDNSDGKIGIPVTHTRDTLLSFEKGEKVVPQEVLEEISDDLEDNPMFSDKEIDEFQSRTSRVEEFILQKQEDDFLRAALRDRQATEESIRDYIDDVYMWEEYGADEEDEDNPDPLEMKIFETRHLGFTEEDYDGADPSEAVVEFREENIMEALNQYIWSNKEDGYQFDASDIPLSEIPVIDDLVGSYGWDNVKSKYEKFDPGAWDDAPQGTDTHELRTTVVENLQEMYGYSEEGAEKTSKYVINEVSEQWE